MKVTLFRNVTLGVMQFRVGRNRHQNEIVRAIIKRIAIEMMHNIAFWNRATKLSLHYQMGLLNPSPIRHTNKVPTITTETVGSFLGRRMKAVKDPLVAMLTSLSYFHFRAAAFWAGIPEWLAGMRLGCPTDFRGFKGMATNTDGGFHLFRVTTLRARLLKMLRATSATNFLSQRTPRATTLEASMQFHFPTAFYHIAKAKSSA